MKYLGDFTAGKTVNGEFNTHKADGTPIALAGTPALSVYKNGSTTETTSGVTLTVDYDSRTGMNVFAIDTSADGTFYAAGNDFRVVITTGTVDGVSVVGTVVGTFSIANRSALRPATADRTILVDASGKTTDAVQTGDTYARIGSGGAGLTALGDTRLANLNAAITSRSSHNAADVLAAFDGRVGGLVNDRDHVIQCLTTVGACWIYGSGFTALCYHNDGPSWTDGTYTIVLDGTTVSAFDLLGNLWSATGDVRDMMGGSALTLPFISGPNPEFGSISVRFNWVPARTDVPAAMALTTGERSSIAAAVRDVDNASPAANSLGAAINSGSGGGGSDVYWVRSRLTKDSPRDEWDIFLVKNGEVIDSGVTVPKLTVKRRSDGEALIDQKTLTAVTGDGGRFTYDATGTERTAAGETVSVHVTATIDGTPRVFVPDFAGRDKTTW